MAAVVPAVEVLLKPVGESLLCRCRCRCSCCTFVGVGPALILSSAAAGGAGAKAAAARCFADTRTWREGADLRRRCRAAQAQEGAPLLKRRQTLPQRRTHTLLSLHPLTRTLHLTPDAGLLIISDNGSAALNKRGRFRRVTTSENPRATFQRRKKSCRLWVWARELKHGNSGERTAFIALANGAHTSLGFCAGVRCAKRHSAQQRSPSPSSF